MLVTGAVLYVILKFFQGFQSASLLADRLRCLLETLQRGVVCSNEESTAQHLGECDEGQYLLPPDIVVTLTFIVQLAGIADGALLAVLHL